VAYGPIELGTLQPGEWREIGAAELEGAMPPSAIARRARRST